MREFALIARHFAPLAGPAGLGLLDDAAVLAPPAGHDLVVTTDAIVAGVHFFPDDPPDTIGHKALAVNLSDLAAKGASPLGFQLAIALPKELDDAWLAAFAAGLGALSAQAGIPLTGGDTVMTPGPLTLSITAFGAVPAGRMVPRGGARKGDRLVVTGTIGDGALGLKARLAEREGRSWPLAADHLAFLADRYLRPKARFMAADMVRIHAHAAMDISDGFAGDLDKMIRLSGHGATVRLADVPLSVAARAAIRFDGRLRDAAFTGGDDYEVLASIAPANVERFMAECLAAGVNATVVGEVAGAGAPVVFEDADGSARMFASASYAHG
jgi:thiamine-monophosphate kinase